MSDEHNDSVEPKAPRTPATNHDPRRVRSQLVARLVARLYRSADRTLRPTLLSCLVRPLSLLGLTAVAAGAFARLPFAATSITVDDAMQFSLDQMVELARFVEQVSPEALQRFAALAAGSPMNAAAFSASAVVLLTKVLQSPQKRPAATSRR